MIASLPMYERPDNRVAHDRFWTSIRNALGFGPKTLTRGADNWETWQDPSLVLSQTCGMPYRNHLHGHVALVGTPDFGLCDRPGYYNSYFLVRKTDENRLENYHDRTFAFNERGSQSGWAAPQNHALGLGFHFARIIETGAHLNSAKAVAEGQADICAIDALTYRLACAHDTFLTDLQVIAETEPTPGLPYITALGHDAKSVFAACETAIETMPKNDKDRLHLKGMVQLEAAQYLQIANPPEILPEST